MLAKLIFKIGQKYRNPSLDKWFVFLKTSENWTLEELQSYQLKRLQELISVAYLESDFYKNKFDSLKIKPSDIQSFDDIIKLPIITKKELITYNDRIHTKVKFKKTFSANTSGTSGESLKFNREESSDSFNRASIFRGYSWYSVNPWECNGYFWGFKFSTIDKIKTRFLDKLQNRFRVFEYKKSEIKKFASKLRNATYLHGYSSSIFETAKIINAQKLEKPTKLKMVKGTSEKIYEAYQKEVEEAYGLRIISEYGAAETGIIAFECPKGKMHINMEGVIVEEIANEIIITNLQMQTFPIIRYKLGDYIELSSKKFVCDCGMHHRVIEEVTGRIGESVYGIKNLYPSLYFYYIFKNVSQRDNLFLNYQVIQDSKGQLDFLIEQKLKSNELNLLSKEIKVYFKEDIKFQIIDSQKLISENHKMKSFISNI